MLAFLLSAFAFAAQPAAAQPDPAPPPAAEADTWAWLNIPDVEGPAARFSYHTAVRRDGNRLQARIRYDLAAAAPTEALVEVDCAARSQRTLERTAGGHITRTPEAAAALIAPATREWVLAFLLCPGGSSPRQ